MTIKIIDNISPDVDLEIRDDSDLDVLLGDLKKFRVDKAIETLRTKSFDDLTRGLKRVSLGLELEQPIDVGDDDISLVISAGASMTVTFYTEADKKLFKKDPHGREIEIGAGERWASASLVASLGIGAELTNKATFGFEASRQVTFTTYTRVSGGSPSLLEGIRQALDAFTILRNFASVETIPEGRIVAVSGCGTLSFSGKANLLAATNPLANVELPAPAGDLDVSMGGSVSVSADMSVTGEYQVRVRRSAGGELELGFLRKKGTKFTVTVDAKAGLAAKVASFELTEKLLGALGGDSEEARAERERRFGEARADLTADEKKSIENAIKAAIDSNLEVSLGLEWSREKSPTEAFLFGAALGDINDEGRTALARAFRGDLSPITHDEDDAASMGFTLLRKLEADTVKSGHVLRVNLLGIFNFRSVEEITLTGTVIFDNQDAKAVLTITDSATAKRVAVEHLNMFVPKKDRLRGALVEAFVATAVYRGSRLAIGAPELTSTHSYVEYHSKTNRRTMKDHLDVAESLELIGPGKKVDILATMSDFKQSTLRAQTDYDHVTFRRAFFSQDRSGDRKPHDEAHFEDIGRQALGALIQSGDEGDYRRKILDDDDWKKLRSESQNRVRSVFRSLTKREAQVVAGDYSVIVWWAKTMSKAARGIAEVEGILVDGQDPSTQEFKDAREKLGKLVRDVAKDTKSRFGEPWGLVAMDMATDREAEAQVTIDWPSGDGHFFSKR